MRAPSSVDAPSPAFTRFPLDRADHLRRDDAALAALRARPDSRIAAFWKLMPFVSSLEDAAPAPVWLAPSHIADAAIEPELFLGLDGAGAPVFAVALDPAHDPTETAPFAGEGRFEALREAAALLAPEDASILATARGVLAWHETHRFCSACGAPSVPALAGWKRSCGACAREHFPRVDPVVIMLVTRGDAVLLGRGKGWPERAYSCLAGFIEPGETVGDAARREVFEEAGVRLGDVSYLVSQPWPFPSSLMLGVRGEALSEEIVVDPQELADARWFDRQEVAAIMAGSHPLARTPPPIAVAHHLLRIWLDES